MLTHTQPADAMMLMAATERPGQVLAWSSSTHWHCEINSMRYQQHVHAGGTADNLQATLILTQPGRCPTCPVVKLAYVANHASIRNSPKHLTMQSTTTHSRQPGQSRHSVPCRAMTGELAAHHQSASTHSVPGPNEPTTDASRQTWGQQTSCEHVQRMQTLPHQHHHHHIKLV